MDTVESREQESFSLSKRCLNEMNESGSPKMPGMLNKAWADPHNFETNPTGYMVFSIAENNLCFDLLKPKLEHDPSISLKLTNYGEFGGNKSCRDGIVHMLESKIFKCEKGSLNYEHVVMGAGCTALLEALFFGLCDAGDTIIIPSPLYPSFICDAKMRALVNIEPASTMKQMPDGKIEFALQIEEFNRAYEKAKSNGSKVSAVILCNPNNPNGYVFSDCEIITLIEWCQYRGIHLVSDEIYALSTFSTSTTFTSVYQVCNGKLGDNIHVISGFSKDFCLNGYRAGYIYSQNKKLLDYVKRISPFFSCPNPVQSVITNILTDHAFLSNYIHTNQNRLKSAYTKTICYLKEVEIPYLESHSGMFLMLDLRAAMMENTWEEESNLWELIFDQAKVLINPGRACKCDIPGFFRFIFSHSDEKLYIGIQRIGKVYKYLVNKKNNQSTTPPAYDNTN